MAGDFDDVPADALEDIAYLARSANRVRLLDALTSRSSRRGALHERTGIAKTTIGRIINEFEERRWVERTSDGEYTVTPTGEQVANEFIPLIDVMAAIRKLGDMVAWIQAPEESIGLHQFSDATVRRPTPTDPMAPTVYYTEGLRDAEEFYCLVAVAPPLAFEIAMREEVTKRDLTVEHVIADSEFRYICDHPERISRWREYVEAGANVYRYDGEVPCNFIILDETVYIAKSQSEYGGEPYTLIESENDVVRSWAHDIIETHRADSTRLDAEDFDA